MIAYRRDQAVLLVIDLQEKLVPHIHGIEAVVANTRRLIRAARALGLPILLTEQYPEGIGPTTANLLPDLEGCPAIAKRTFSCWREPAFRERLAGLGRTQAILAGVETHVCVFQTGADLRRAGYQVQVVSDAVSSRTEANKAVGLGRLAAAGADLSSVESCLFELLGTSACPEFKSVLALVK